MRTACVVFCVIWAPGGHAATLGVGQTSIIDPLGRVLAPSEPQQPGPRPEPWTSPLPPILPPAGDIAPGAAPGRDPGTGALDLVVPQIDPTRPLGP